MGELTGGPITTTGTIGLANTAVGAGLYGTNAAWPIFTVDTKGRITNAGTIPLNISFSIPITSAQFAAIISDPTGTGLVVFNNAPTLTAPVINGGSVSATTVGVTNANPADATTQLATDAFVQNVVAAQNLGQYATLANPIFTGDPRAPTPAPGDNDTSIATTAFVTGAITLATVVLKRYGSDISIPAGSTNTSFSTPFLITEGVALLSTSFTPTNAASKIRVRATLPAVGNQGGTFVMGIFVGAGPAALSVSFMQFGNAAFHAGPMFVEYEFVAGTVSAINIASRYAGNSSQFGSAQPNQATFEIVEYVP